MKRQENLAPSTIRHRHGALALRKHADIMAQNPLSPFQMPLRHF